MSNGTSKVVNPATPEKYFTCFSEALEYYIQEKNKPKNQSNYREARKMMKRFVWAPPSFFIGNSALSMMATDIKMNYWLDNPERIPDSLIKDLNEVNAEYFKMKYPQMQTSPTEKLKLEKHEMDRVIERINSIERSVIDYCEGNEEFNAVMGMPIISRAKLTRAVISFIRTILSDIITNFILDKNKNTDSIKRVIDDMPDTNLIQRAMKKTSFKDASDIISVIDKPIKEMRDKLDEDNADPEKIIFDTMSYILTVIENSYYYEFSSIINEFKKKINKKAKKETPTIFDKIDLNNASIEAKAKMMAKEKIEKEKAKAKEASSDTVIVPEVVENKDGKMSMAVMEGTIVDATVMDDVEYKPEEMEQIEIKLNQSQPTKIEDPTDDPIRLTDNVVEPEGKGKKPEIISDAAKESKTEPEVSITKPEINIPDEYKDLIDKNPWIMDIIDVGWKAESKISYQFGVICDIGGNPKLIQFNAFTTENKLNPAKSFTVDMGQIVSKEFGIWPNFDQYGTVFPVENCTAAYRLFLRGEDKKRKFNKELVHNIASFGFDGLSKDDKAKFILYGENILNNNRHVALITLPYDRNHRKHYQNAATKLTKLIESSHDLIDGLDLRETRFRVVSHDPSVGSVTFSNAKMSKYYLFGQDVAPVYVEFTLTPVVVKDSQGRMSFKTDEKKITIFDVYYKIIPKDQYNGI